MTYQEFVMKIWTEQEHTDKGIAIAGLGMIGEAGEVCEAVANRDSANEILLECGDVIYYLQVLSDWMGVDMQAVLEEVEERQTVVLFNDANLHCLHLIINCKEISEPIKKYLRDGTPVDKEQFAIKLDIVLRSLRVVLSDSNYYSLMDAVVANVKKLEVRYASAL